VPWIDITDSKRKKFPQNEKRKKAKINIVTGKKLFFWGFISIISIFSCSKNNSVTTIEFWTLQLSPTFNQYFNELIQEYEKKNPSISIKWVDIPYDAVIQKLLASIASGDAPDVVNLSSDFLAKFNDIQALVDFATLYPKDIFQIFLPNALENCTFDGKIIALPWYLNTYVTIYNKALINDAGFQSNDIPKTFSELIQFVRNYKNRTSKFALFWNIGKDSYLPMMLESEGIAMTNDEMTRAEFNSQKGIELISQWVDLYREGYLDSEAIIKPGSSIIEPYQSGQSAIVFTGPVFLKRVKENALKIYEQTDIAPAIVGSTGKYELATMALSVLGTSEKKKEAAYFAMYVVNAKNQLAFSKLTTTFPSVSEALNDPFFTTDDGTVESKARNIGVKELPYSVRLRKYLQHPKFDELRDIFDEAIQKACLEKLTTKEAMDKAAEEWNRISGNYSEL